MSDSKSTTAHIKTQANERIKQHVIFDLQGRPWKVYTAQVNANKGQECEVTEYVYKAIDSTDMKARKEGVDVWDPADENWDGDFTI